MSNERLKIFKLEPKKVSKGLKIVNIIKILTVPTILFHATFMIIPETGRESYVSVKKYFFLITFS